MKHLYIIIFLFGALNYTLGQCIEGNCQNGTGVMVFESGNKYKGEFKNGMREGKGTFVWTSGAKYQGEWLADKLHGNGTYIYPDRRIHKGEFKYGLKNGHGVLTTESGQVLQKGVWKDDEFLENSRTRTYVNVGTSIFESVLPTTNFYLAGECKYVNPTGLSVDFGITNNVNLGLYLGYANHNYNTSMELNNLAQEVDVRYSYILTGGRVTYSAHIFEGDWFTPYLGAMAGYNVSSESYRVAGNDETDVTTQELIRKSSGIEEELESAFIYSAFLGVRVFPIKKIGLFVEGGLGFNNLNGGISVRF